MDQGHLSSVSKVEALPHVMLKVALQKHTEVDVGCTLLSHPKTKAV